MMQGASCSSRRVLVAAGIGLLVGGVGAAQGQPAGAPPIGCVTCHQGLSDARLSAPVQLLGDDVHRARGFVCVDCHGGDPSATEAARAHDRARGYRGKPAGAAIVEVCAGCHSDAALMRKYAPRQRVDQASEYATSVHGQQLAKGDGKVATCVSCHGAHGIRMVSDAKSPVFPLNVEATCSRCHGNADYMKGYTIAGGAPLPTDQATLYEKSVHHRALTRDNDLSAPTCNDCHGNHGAAPPGVGAVVNVCGTCHAVFATKFALSTHSQIFERGCVECHGNHDVEQPSDALLGTDHGALCGTCHAEGDNGYLAARRMRSEIERLKQAIDGSGALVARVENAGIELSDQELALREARNHLTLARTEVHTFDPTAVVKVLREGLDISGKVDQAGQAALGELRFRRTGLAISLFAILIVVVALALKIRQIDRAHGVKS
jgi:predicted CXXCH cytochrome family protein